MKTRFFITFNGKVKLSILIAILFTVTSTYSSTIAATSTFHVEVIGQGIPMILIPGMASSGDVWKSTVIHYQNKYQCHVLTLAGFAGIPAALDDGFLDHVKNDIVEYIKENNLQKPVIIGHGLGGFLALWIASEEPALVGKIVVVDELPYVAAAHYPNMNPDLAYPFASKMRERMMNQPDDDYRSSMKYYFRNLITDTSVADGAAKWGETSDKATVAECTFELQVTDLREEIQKITVPALVFATWKAGKSDQTHDGIEEVFTAQYYLLKNYRLVIDDNSRNFVMLDDPDGFFYETDKFLSGN